MENELIDININFKLVAKENDKNVYQRVKYQTDKRVLELLMDLFNNNQTRVAKTLGLNRSTVRKMLKEHDLI